MTVRRGSSAAQVEADRELAERLQAEEHASVAAPNQRPPCRPPVSTMPEPSVEPDLEEVDGRPLPRPPWRNPLLGPFRCPAAEPVDCLRIPLLCYPSDPFPPVANKNSGFKYYAFERRHPSGPAVICGTRLATDLLGGLPWNGDWGLNPKGCISLEDAFTFLRQRESEKCRRP